SALFWCVIATTTGWYLGGGASAPHTGLYLSASLGLEALLVFLPAAPSTTSRQDLDRSRFFVCSARTSPSLCRTRLWVKVYGFVGCCAVFECKRRKDRFSGVQANWYSVPGI
ncbi:unnamed protein product, partial [Ectocarpus sp. 8 AP-2014]